MCTYKYDIVLISPIITWMKEEEKPFLPCNLPSQITLVFFDLFKKYKTVQTEPSKLGSHIEHLIKTLKERGWIGYSLSSGHYKERLPIFHQGM